MVMRINCSTEWSAAAAHHPVRIANVTLRSSVGTQLAVFDRPDVVSNRLSQRTHTFEPAEMAAFAALLLPQTVVLDIGSNIGWWTFNFATTHAVHAFEPNPSNLALQALSRCLNPRLARRITTYPVGLYDREPARCEIHSPPRNLGNTHTLCGTIEEIAAKVNAHAPLALRGNVEMRTLDTLVPEWVFNADKIVKLDIEGSEQVALMGATRLLTDGLPPRALFMEITFYKGTKRRELYRFLERHGYVPARMVRYNMLFVHAREQRAVPPGRRDWVSPAVCDDYCAFHRLPACNATCGLRGMQNCCGWWTA
jgi:FkbM family methyltransferase